MVVKVNVDQFLYKFVSLTYFRKQWQEERAGLESKQSEMEDRLKESEEAMERNLRDYKKVRIDFSLTMKCGTVCCRHKIKLSF